MKKTMQYLIPVLLITFLINAAYGFPGMTNNSTAQPVAPPDLNNTTQSDQDIVMVQHLIELDAIQLQSENRLFVRETLIFRNTGTKNFSGSLRTWVQDGAQDINLGKSEMMAEGIFEPVPFDQNGNIISWQDFVEQNSALPLLYVIEYNITGTSYSKKLTVPALINYKYGQRTDLPALVLKVTKPDNGAVAILDENRNKIAPSETSEEGNSATYRFYSPQFKEINIEFSKSAVTPSAIGIYAALGILILLVLSYPIVRKKSERLRAVEDKVRNSLKQKPEEATKEPTKGSEVADDKELMGKTRDELENKKNELISKIDKLDRDYASGDLLDEEYEELRNSYREKLEKITKKIKQ